MNLGTEPVPAFDTEVLDSSLTARPYWARFRGIPSGLGTRSGLVPKPIGYHGTPMAVVGDVLAEALRRESTTSSH
jgi:hypothetical protein